MRMQLALSVYLVAGAEVGRRARATVALDARGALLRQHTSEVAPRAENETAGFGFRSHSDSHHSDSHAATIEGLVTIEGSLYGFGSQTPPRPLDSDGHHSDSHAATIEGFNDA